jgi:hypothetical protein
MCWACARGGPASHIDPSLLARARRIEEKLPGEVVPEQAWRILLGLEDGGIMPAHYERMLASLDKAASSPLARLRCDGVTD